ncbi:MAG TPA: hypothetical protein VLL30_09195, partial [Reyranella sp.]|nr:hypothetical protein [Reyranella sp.]
MGDDEIGDLHRVAEIDDGQRTIRQWFVAQHGDDLGIVGIEQGLADLAVSISGVRYTHISSN